MKASVNKKRNNVGTYNRFHLRKLLINEVMFNSFEITNHIKYFIKDEHGSFGASPKHTVIVMEDDNMDEYIEDLRSPLAQMMLTVIKDYNHNDSKLFRYLPKGMGSIQLTAEEQALVDLFDETSIDKVHSLPKRLTPALVAG